MSPIGPGIRAYKPNPMASYLVRPATLADIDVLVEHRKAMFIDMGSSPDPAMDRLFRAWLQDAMPLEVYRAWLAVDATGEVAAGGGITVLPWPPGPQSMTGRAAFAYNGYTEPRHRRRGLGRMVMEAVHAWCRDHGVGAVMLNASAAGQPLYRSMGYDRTVSPMMLRSLD